MLVVISNPTAIANEASIINTLFDEGLRILHLRKPGIAPDEMSALIEQIKQSTDIRLPCINIMNWRMILEYIVCILQKSGEKR